MISTHCVLWQSGESDAEHGQKVLVQLAGRMDQLSDVVREVRAARRYRYVVRLEESGEAVREERRIIDKGNIKLALNADAAYGVETERKQGQVEGALLDMGRGLGGTQMGADVVLVAHPLDGHSGTRVGEQQR